MCKKQRAAGISVEEFLQLLWQKYKGKSPEGMEWLFSYGRQQGWLEEQDELNAREVLERRSAARILHEFLRKEMAEPDEDSWGTATELADLYDCRICVNHVAQIYAKGIMGEFCRTPGGRPLFGMREEVTGEEAGKIVERALEKETRLWRKF